jgi:catechol 2,3-dioxygenase-like lactoylglutathione lyase family enzyme
MSEPASHSVRVRFVYGFCNDVDAMRRFYSEILGMKAQSYQNDAQFGWLSYDDGRVGLMFFRWDTPLPVQDGWAWQPGGGGGDKPYASWSVEVPEAAFRGVLAKLAEAAATMQSPKPDWRQDSYWGIMVKDPMGNTVEVYTTPKERPASTEWE